MIERLLPLLSRRELRRLRRKLNRSVRAWEARAGDALDKELSRLSVFCLSRATSDRQILEIVDCELGGR